MWLALYVTRRVCVIIVAVYSFTVPFASVEATTIISEPPYAALNAASVTPDAASMLAVPLVDLLPLKDSVTDAVISALAVVVL